MKIIEVKILVTDHDSGETKEQIITLRELKTLLDGLDYQSREEKCICENHKVAKHWACKWVGK